MSDLIPKSQKKTGTFHLPDQCGVDRCSNPCDIYIKQRNISRCTKHYLEDLDRYRLRKSAMDFATDQAMYERLTSIGLGKIPTETNSEYAQRCRQKCSEMMAGGFKSLISERSGTA